MKEFDRVLVANRGEIALRVLRALRALGIEGGVVYSDADVGALPTLEADRAYRLPGTSPTDTYLNADAIVEIARKSDSDAIHPGYGFLSENPELPRKCRASSIVFIGPSPEALEKSGNKLEVKRLAEAKGVPVVPYSREPLGDADEAVRFAGEIGFPVLLKSAFGGGGRGIKEARNPDEVRAGFASSEREARAAFGRAQVFVEKKLVRPRHIEVQVLASAGAGEVVHLGERECSIQRRYQKLVEIAPSPVVDDPTRERLGNYARTILEAVGYSNAGTVEFLRDSSDGRFYLLEINARLQVEHPVTELVTGIDLVASQIHVARTGALPFRQSDVRRTGVAIECRINAEEPLSDFMPRTGRVDYLRLPGGPGVRVDTALFEGMEVTPYYDSLLAKLVTWGSDREEARRRGLAALEEFRLAGIPSTIPFHRKVLAHPAFVRGDLSTAFLDESGVLTELAEESARATVDRFAVAALLLSKNPFRSGPAPSARAGVGPRPPFLDRGGRFVDGG